MTIKQLFLPCLSCLVLTLPNSGLAKKSSDTVQVDCAKGESIMKALETPADVLTIEISGICEEDVKLYRSNVNLVGTDPLLDGIRPAPDQLLNNGLNMFNVRQVRIENLGFSGAIVGLGVNSSFGVDIINCRVENNSGVGIIFGTASGSNDVIDTVVTGNGNRGIWAANGSSFRCWNCDISDQTIGLQVTQGSEAGLFDSTVQGTRAVDVAEGGRVYSLGGNTLTTLDGSSTAMRLLGGASADFFQGMVINGKLDLQEQSNATLRNVSQTLSAGANLVRSAASLVLRGTTSLAGDVQLEEFATLSVPGGNTIAGSLQCSRGADAYCDDPGGSVGGTSDCGQCPKP